jgi:hypothetical protein
MRFSRDERGEAPTNVWQNVQNESVIPGFERFGIRRKLESAGMHCIINRDAENEKRILSFCRDAARSIFAVGPIHICIEK